MNKKEYMKPEATVVPLMIEQIMTTISGVDSTNDFDTETDEETTDTPL